SASANDRGRGSGGGHGEPADALRDLIRRDEAERKPRRAAPAGASGEEVRALDERDAFALGALEQLRRLRLLGEVEPDEVAAGGPGPAPREAAREVPLE